MTPIILSKREWLAINPEYRAIVDHTPHVFAFDEERSGLVLVPVTISDPLRTRRRPARGTRQMQLA